MPKTCSICQKKPTVGNWRKLLRGHYNVTGKRRFKPNLQKAVIDGKRVTACVKCIRQQNRSARKRVSDK